ncbi:MAG: DegV family protein [Clostridia bacterium]|nr:DegV family protein [Clostridia bacterium]
MRPVKIVTDSCSDLAKDLREKFDIDYLPMNTVMHGKEQPASLDWESYSPSELYDTIRGGERVTTTQVPAAAFEEAFPQYLQDGFDVIYIACSGKCSGSVNTAQMVADSILPSFPGATIACIDSLNASLGEGLVAIKAAQLRDEGLDAATITETLLPLRNTVNMFVTVHNLNALKAAGRVKASSAFFGNLLGVKPIIISDVNGDNVAYKKVKGRYNSIVELVNLMADAIIEPEKQCIYIGHSDCLEEAKELEALLKERIPEADTYVGYIGPIIGASIGADALAIFAFGEHVERFSV